MQRGQIQRENKAVYIKSLSLEEIKCFGTKQTISFESKGKPQMWTMILGDNGTGKSTILKAIALALSQNEEDAKYLNLFEFIRREEKDSSIGLTVFEKNKALPRNTYVFLRPQKSSLHIFRPNLSKFNVPVFGYGSYRKLGNSGFVPNESTFQSAGLFNDEVNLINAEDWLLRADYSKVKSNHSGRQLNRVKKLLLDVLRDEISEIEIKEKGANTYGVDFKTRYGWVNIKNLSTGYKSLITWMVDLANWLSIYYPESENPLHEQAIVLVDEIDLHLHVSLQKNLVKFLRETFPKIQFIATAHSPLMVQGSEEENIIVLEKDNDHVVAKNNPINVKNWRVDQILTSDLFGLETSRSSSTEIKLKRRRELISKGKLDKKEQVEMDSLDGFVQRIPKNEDPVINEANRIILEAAETLKKMRK